MPPPRYVAVVTERDPLPLEEIVTLVRERFGDATEELRAERPTARRWSESRH